MKNGKYSVLLVEDDKVDQLAFQRFVEQNGLNYEYEIVSSFREAQGILSEKQFDVVITDYFLGDGTAFDIFKYINNSSIIITTGTGDEEIAVRAMKSGAYDYLIKDPDRHYLTVLPVTVENALKQKQAALDHTRVKVLESAVLHAFDAVIIIEVDLSKGLQDQIIFVNKAFEKMSGYGLKEIAGKSMHQLFGERTDQKRIERIRENFKQETGMSTEMIFYKKNGTPFWVEFSMQPVSQNMKSIKQWVFIQRDISERKRSENQVRQSKERLDIILQSMGDGVVVIDEQLTIMKINSRALQLLGNLPQEQSALNLQDVLVNCQNSGQELLERLHQSTFTNFELCVVKPIQRVLLVTGTSFLDVDGHSAGKVFIIKDFTKQKEIEQMKNDFVSNVSHELRTPLASILGFSSTILKDQNMIDEVKTEFTEIIYKESIRLSQLIEDILSISKIEAGRSLYNPEKIELEPIVDEILKTFQHQTKMKGIKIKKEVDKDLKPIYVDKKAIKQIFVNLLGNAIKFTQEKGLLSVRLANNENSVKIFIKDNGIGIPEKDLSRIFDKFYRVHRSGTPIPGTGLGLSIVKQIVDFHKGKIEVESKENVGTTMKIKLPAYEVN